MKKLITILLSIFFVFSLSGQNKISKQTAPIVKEGKLLFKSEMASWYGTDLFLAQYENQENIGGYLSYSDSLVSRCIFYSRDESPTVIGTMDFDTSFQIETAIVDLEERPFSKIEKDLFEIREVAIEQVQIDTFFKHYENTNLNLIPLINGKDKKVYILTGPTQHGVVIFGNDYLLTFDKENKISSQKALHKNIIPIEYSQEIEGGGEVMGAVHNHQDETGDFMTATDICTLMMYSKYAKWEKHTVISPKYMSIWDCKKNVLNVIPLEVYDNIEKQQEKKDKKDPKKGRKDKAGQ